VSLLTEKGHQVVRLVRTPTSADELAAPWDPLTGAVDTVRLDKIGIEAAVHLAGENIGSGRWTKEKKARLYDSRVKGTRLLCEALAKLAAPPRVLVCASAIGVYGNRGDEVLDESSSLGSGFLADMCRQRELATEPMLQKGARVVFNRFGVIYSLKGGALPKLLRLFQKGLGGQVGNGRQWSSWITLEDAVGALHHALTTAELQGPANTVTPNPVTNREFTRTLGRVLGRATWFRKPAFLIRLIMGEMANDLLLASVRVQPRRLLDTGYTFRHPQLDEALRHLLEKPQPVG
jgi:uncharacterized protein (TIGR01777 family)